MPATITHRPAVFTADIPLPESIAAFFRALANHGTVKFAPSAMQVSLTIASTDDTDLDIALRQTVNDVARSAHEALDIQGITKITATDHDVRIGVTSDMRIYFDILIGLGAVRFTVGNPHVTLILEGETQAEVAESAHEIAAELSAYFGAVDFVLPRRVLSRSEALDTWLHDLDLGDADGDALDALGDAQMGEALRRFADDSEAQAELLSLARGRGYVMSPTDVAPGDTVYPTSPLGPETATVIEATDTGITVDYGFPQTPDCPGSARTLFLTTIVSTGVLRTRP